MAMVDEEKIFKEKQAAFFSDVERGNTQAVASMLDRKPLRNFRDEEFPWLTMTKGGEHMTAFLLAAENGCSEMLQMLATKGSTIHGADNVGDTALHLAAGNNHIAAMRVLLGLGVSIDAQNQNGATALYKATKSGKLEAVNLLLAAKASVEIPNRTNQAPLACAAREGKLEAVALLLQAGASPHAEDRDKKTAMHHCIPGYTTRLTHQLWFHSACKGDVKGLRALLAQQIGSVGDEGWKDLGRALFQPQGQDQFKLNAHRSLCNARDGSGFTALSCAVQANHPAATDYLLSQAADAGLSDDLRETPLHHAARLGHAHLAEKLINEGAPLEALNLSDVTPLHIAAFFGHDAVCTTLLTNKANVMPYDKQHETPLHHAVTHQHAKTIGVLVNHGAALGVQDMDFKTPGVRACEARVALEKPRPRKLEDVADYDVELTPPKPPETYKVVHDKFTPVRATPSRDAKVMGAKAPGEKVLVREVVNGWAKLDESTTQKELWMLVDATSFGLGVLLEKVEEPKAQKEEGKTGEAEDDDDDDDDGDFEG